jgi:hypothetical protein
MGTEVAPRKHAEQKVAARLEKACNGGEAADRFRRRTRLRRRAYHKRRQGLGVELLLFHSSQQIGKKPQIFEGAFTAANRLI